MKVGVDAVILGAWADSTGSSILDIGCGCGVISLMMAQRNPNARIIGIDIHEQSVIEANDNFNSSPWNTRLEAKNIDFMEFPENKLFDLLISNPPYFDSGIVEPDTPRLIARHESFLSPKSILRKGKNILKEKGRIALVVPFEREEEVKGEALASGYFTLRILRVSGSEGKMPKRSFMEFVTDPAHESAYERAIQTFCIQNREGEYTSEYHSLCEDFYLKF